MSTTLPLFWHLSSASTKERVESSVKLVAALEQFQAQFTSPSDTSDADDDEDALDPLDKYNAQDVSYSIRRLVRGLASPRESSRLGFSVALTELLSRITTITCSQIFSLIISSTKLTKSISGQEERDILFARLFGIMSIVQSGLLIRTDPLSQSPSSSTAASSLPAFKEIITELIFIAGKKSWLRESVWWTVILALQALDNSSVAWKDEALEYVLESIYTNDPQWSPEKVAVTLNLQTMSPDRDWRRLTAPTFSTPDLLSTPNLQTLAQILKDTEDADNMKSGSWKPDLHFAWTTVLDRLIPANAPAKANLAEFFRLAVDESLFSSNATPQRKYWGFQIFQKALPRVAEDVLPMIFTKNFMRTWINHLSKPDRYLHKAAKQTALDVAAFVKERPTLGMGLIVQLTGPYGSPQFDKLTRTKTVETILASMTANGIMHYIDHLVRQFNDCDGIDGNDVETINACRSWIIDQMLALVRNGSLTKDDAWVKGILEWLIVNGLFIVRKTSKQKRFRGTEHIVKPPLSDALRENCRARLMSALGDLTNYTTVVKNDAKPTRVLGVDSEGEFWICHALKVIEALHKDSKHLTPLSELESDDQAIHDKVKSLSGQLHQTQPDLVLKESAQGCRLLISGLLIFEYCSEEPGWETEILQSCMDLSENLVPKANSKKRTKPEKTETDKSPVPIDGLVDIIIGLLEKSSSYLRTLGNNSFSLLSGSVTDASIDLILAQLERRDPTEDDDMEDENMEEDVDVEDSDEDSQDVNEEEEEEDDDDDDDAEVDDELKNKILEALKMNGVEPVTGDSDEEDIEMDDDQMLALDSQLAEAFKSRMQERKSGKDLDAQREATHFKNRVLDLVDLFVKKQPTSPLVINLILPLVTLIASCGSDEKQLVDKAQGILRSRISKSKEIPDAPLDKVSEVLEALHTRARKSRSDLSSTISACCIHLSKIMVHHNASDIVLAQYQATLDDFLTRKNSALTPVFFQDFIAKFSKLAWGLRQPILELSVRAVNAYRRLQALRLIHSLLNNMHFLNDDDEEITAFMTSLRRSLHGLVSDACESKATLNAAQVKDVFKLALSALRHTVRLQSADVVTIWAPKKWQKLSEKLAAAPNLQSSIALPTLCQQMVTIANAPPKPKGIKRKGEAVAELYDSKHKRSKIE